MSDSAHIFTPQDDSLRERVRSFWQVLDAFRNAEASLKYIDNKQWADSLGEKEEVKQAYKISKRSLHMANASIKQSELSQAREQGLMSDDEVIEFTQAKRQQEMQSIRDAQSNSDSRQHTHKR